jgi:hypothetical protein
MMVDWLPWCLSASLMWGGPADASAVLHDWDDRRAAAWAADDPGALRALYTGGSPVGRADVALLRRWHERGLRVDGMQLQLLEIEVRRASATHLDLVVTDRLTGAVARRPGVRVPLPADVPSTSRVVLVRDGGTWRVRQASAVRMTSWTVRSRKE